jgi:hypothetical protein
MAELESQMLALNPPVTEGYTTHESVCKVYFDYYEGDNCSEKEKPRIGCPRGFKV